ncbi:hypothetical protein ABKN59_007031 [Abortiporus biennis]
MYEFRDRLVVRCNSSRVHPCAYLTFCVNENLKKFSTSTPAGAIDIGCSLSVSQTFRFADVAKPGVDEPCELTLFLAFCTANSPYLWMIPYFATLVYSAR